MFYEPNGWCAAVVDLFPMLTITGELERHSRLPDAIEFENSVSTIRDGERERFLQFAQRMIRWDPRERSTAQELLQDPWLHSYFAEAQA